MNVGFLKSDLKSKSHWLHKNKTRRTQTICTFLCTKHLQLFGLGHELDHWLYQDAMKGTIILETTESRVRLCYHYGQVNWWNKITQCTVPCCDCNNKKKKSLTGAKTDGWHPAVEDITIKIDSSRRLEKGKEKQLW